MSSNNLDRPIFLLCSERSGSNLIRVIQGNHSKIAAPPAIHLTNTFLPLLPCYGDLKIIENFRNLCSDVFTEIHNQIGIWEASFSVEDMVNDITERTFPAVYSYVYSKETETQNAERVFIKDNYLFFQFYYFEKNFPDAKFIYQVRDGRDFAVSCLKTPPFIFESVEEIAKQWRDEQRQCLSIYTQMKDAGKVMPVHYEDLVGNSEDTIKRICEFIEVEFEPNMLEFYKEDKNMQDSKSAKAWRNLSQPIKAKNFGKYKKELSAGSIRKFESIAYRELTHAGYMLENKIEGYINANRTAETVKKAFAMGKNLLKGKTIGIEELKARKNHYNVLNEITTNLELNSGEILHCKAIHE
ncbi:sulfotransferase [bacterium AH-315-C07]|nr:sulfotransferase [bacterium AH-315-C07]